MNIIEAIVYGAIQGLSEFLPISSSGHLALLPYVMNIADPGVVFDLMMHIGTALAVIIYFRREIIGYAKTLTPSLMNLKEGSRDQWFVRNFIVATFVSVAVIVLLMPVAKLARNPHVIMVNLAVFGALLWASDLANRKYFKHLESPMETGLQIKLAALVGMAQALAIFPGVSRSGITLTMALFLGMKRKDAGNFSFLLSLPIILAGALKEVPDLFKESSTVSIPVALTGVLTSFIVGWVTVHFFMKLISKIQLGYFTVYRWLLVLIMFFVIG